jgi:large subunit ribosomal protein L4
MQAKIIDLKVGAPLKDSVPLNKNIFATENNAGLVHQVVRTELMNKRSGSVAQKSRSEVKCTGKKPWKQKGTGNARAGSFASPIWRSGGVTFAAKPKVYQLKVNKKMLKKAFCCVLSDLMRADRIAIVDQLDFDHPKTKNMRQVLEKMQWEGKKILMLVEDCSENLYLSTRNLYRISISTVAQMQMYQLLNADKILISQSSLKKLEEWLNRE